jgi:hypothetical protein
MQADARSLWLLGPIPCIGRMNVMASCSCFDTHALPSRSISTSKTPSQDRRLFRGCVQLYILSLDPPIWHVRAVALVAGLHDLICVSALHRSI